MVDHINQVLFKDTVINIFKSMSAEDVDDILKYSQIKKYYKSEVILSHQNSTDAFYVLLDGIVQVGYLSPSGRYHAFHYYSDKNLMNLVPCLNKQALDYDYHALNQVTVLIIPEHILLSKMNNNNNLFSSIFELTAKRMQALLQELKFLHVASLHQKLCRILWGFMQQYGVYHSMGTEIELKLSQHDLAEFLSASRQTINREIKNMVNNNILVWEYEKIIIKNSDYLKHQVNLV
ncbi:Crp/Fnr family transcriptional regulator [Acinetobacter chinensis]|uniref:Crp/Fnr family transcriptional regulator n=1 Tax=Acinetobacter chinensis TaxID=2004650 RepID=UPI0029350D6F|nr:Crp/Fnr family transcriptional regulator [Acinetobacter chinensis]WOE41511.1 Crp/Fnr family transcriptional regulator [Acinetobacter chinensis]